MKTLLNTSDFLTRRFGIKPPVYGFCNRTEQKLLNKFHAIDALKQFNQYKVLDAFQENKISEAHLYGTTGYGYGDIGREGLEAVYAHAFGAEDALVRNQIISGTHALAVSLYSVLESGDTLVAVTGKPYDTLDEVIGLKGDSHRALMRMGVNYKQVELTADGEIDFTAIAKKVDKHTKSIFIQRSKGYQWRDSIGVDKICGLIKFVREINPEIICIVDNCYGEFTELVEPVQVGADIMAGSLIKNPGGGLAPTGGYIAGRAKYIEQAAYTLTAPGLGKDCGCSLDFNKPALQGFFTAPHTVGESLKGALLCAALFDQLKFDTCPGIDDFRADIVQAVKFGSEQLLKDFCVGIQKGAPINSFVTPEPWDMPGYDCNVIMAAGAFTQGSSIELSADGPIRPPYIAYFQGGLTYEHAKIGLMIALQHMIDAGHELRIC